MCGIVRSRVVTIFNKICCLTFNPNASATAANPNRKLSTTISSISRGTAQHPKSPPPPLPTTGSWKEKLSKHSLKYWLLGSACAVSTAIFTYYYFADRFVDAADRFVDAAEAQEKSDSVKISSFEERVASIKVDFEYDEKDLIDDKSIRKLYERWLTQYGVTRHPKKKEAHYQAFKQNAYNFYFFNKLHKDCLLGLNKFAAMTEEERNKYF